MNTLTCLIVDDEPIARGIIAAFCAHIPALRIIGQCENAFEAKSMLNERQRLKAAGKASNVALMAVVKFNEDYNPNYQPIYA